MLAQVLALHLALLDPAAAPEVHFLPPLELSVPLPVLADATSGSPMDASATDAAPGNTANPTTVIQRDMDSATAADAAPMVVRAEPRSGSVLHGYGGALAGTLASDLVFGGIVALGVQGWVASGGLFGGDSNSGWAMVALAGVTGFVFVTPAVMVWGAQKAARRRAPGAAYAAAFAVRLLGFLLAPTVPAVVLVTELVAAPLAVAAIVATGSPVEQGVTPPPDAPAAPEPLPGPAGPRISRPICPDAALALR